MSTCRCEAYRHPHRPLSGECHGHDLADCPDQIVVVDPYGTGDRWHRWADHGCGRADNVQASAGATGSTTRGQK